jgi:hypothetical protein
MSSAEEGFDALGARIEAETAESSQPAGETIEIQADQIEAALSKSLADI